MWSDFIVYGVRRGEFRDIDAGEVIDILLFSYQGVQMLSPVLPVGSETPERIIGHIQRLLLKEE